MTGPPDPGDDVPRAQLAGFLSRLGKTTRYALVKNPEIWASLARGGDWDLAVEDLGAAARVLHETCGPPDKIVRRSYVVACYYRWGEIDLLSSVSWRGAEILPLPRLFDLSEMSEEGVRVACLAHQAMSAWISPLLYSRTFRGRYAELVEAAVEREPEELYQALTHALGSALAAQLIGMVRAGGVEETATLARSMRHAVVRSGLAHRPLATSLGALRHAQREIALRLMLRSRASSP